MKRYNFIAIRMEILILMEYKYSVIINHIKIKFI